MASPQKLVITLGDPAGCGPVVVFRAIKSLINKPFCFFVIGDECIAKQVPEYNAVENKIFFFDVATKNAAKIKKGSISKIAGRASLAYLRKALELIEKDRSLSLVTAPVSKEAISLASPGFRGHTEFLTEWFGGAKTAMMLASEKLRVVLLTRHVDLRDVTGLISRQLVLDTVSLTYSFLKEKKKLKNPSIALASFNPHAGVDTFMKKEEKVMKAAVLDFKRKIYGPYPCDTLFHLDKLRQFDCIISPYHDQGMLAFKMLSFRFGVNITLGLPIVRTSPSHGVAFQLTKKAPERIFHSSMRAAIIEAANLNS